MIVKTQIILFPQQKSFPVKTNLLLYVVGCALFFLHYLEGSLINVIPYFIPGDLIFFVTLTRLWPKTGNIPVRAKL